MKKTIIFVLLLAVWSFAAMGCEGDSEVSSDTQGETTVDTPSSFRETTADEPESILDPTTEPVDTASVTTTMPESSAVSDESESVTEPETEPETESETEPEPVAAPEELYELHTVEKSPLSGSFQCVEADFRRGGSLVLSISQTNTSDTAYDYIGSSASLHPYARIYCQVSDILTYEFKMLNPVILNDDGEVPRTWEPGETHTNERVRFSIPEWMPSGSYTIEIYDFSRTTPTFVFEDAFVLE